MPKIAFQGLFYTGMPDLDALRGIYSLPFINGHSYAGWTDLTGMPSGTWYDNVAAGYTNARNYLLLDQEAWPVDTQVNRLATADQFATVYTELKSRRPDLSIGFYSYPIIRDLFRAITLPGAADYIAWQGENNDLAAMWAALDLVFPSIYYFYNVATNGAHANDPAHSYFHENIAEAQRLRTAYGNPSQLIVPYVNQNRADGAGALDPVVWIDMIQTAYLEGDGLILWNGESTAWDESAAWWVQFKTHYPFNYVNTYYVLDEMGAPILEEADDGSATDFVLMESAPTSTAQNRRVIRGDHVQGLDDWIMSYEAA